MKKPRLESKQPGRVIFTVYVSQDIYDKLVEIARRNDIGVSTLVRILLVNLVKTGEIDEYIGARKQST